MSVKYSLNKQDLEKIGIKFLEYVGLSAATFLISLIPQVNIPPQYAVTAGVVLSVVGLLLVSAQKFFAHELGIPGVEVAQTKEETTVVVPSLPPVDAPPSAPTTVVTP